MTENSSTAAQDSTRPKFESEITLFTQHIDAIGGVLIGAVVALQLATKKVRDELTKFEDEHCEVEDDGKTRRVTIPSDSHREWRKHSRTYQHFELSRMLLPRSLLVSMISQYDAYLGRLLRVIFLRKPEILNTSEKKLSFDALIGFASIDAAREYILEKEVESILRSSHVDQFKWMEKAFKVTLTTGLPSWPVFVEVTERRNLFVHTDGVVSSQYLTVCKAHKCQIPPETTEGSRLSAPQDYFEKAHSTVFEIGVKLGHVLWRKLFPDDREAADTHLGNLAYELIDRGKYELAIVLLDFACDVIKKFANESLHLMFVVNRAQAYKWSGNEARCLKIMKGVDWSAKGDHFRLAEAVLTENWDSAARIMRRIGKDGPVEKTQYRDWPLFKNFRKQTAFTSTYAEIFGEDFSDLSETKEEALGESDNNTSQESVES